MTGIKFGTDGWRAIVGKDFTEENVAIVTKAIGKYVFDNFGINKKIIIGYDPRNLADVFSMQSAEVLKQMGFSVLYSDKVLPTPVLAYNAKHLNACAIMFTASHNPPEYLGMKFIPDYAGPATSDITDELTHNLGMECFKPSNVGSITIYDFQPDYNKHLENIVDYGKIKTLKTNIIFNGFYSSSIGYFDKLLEKYNIPFSTMNMFHDTNFGGGRPDPQPKYMQD